MKGVTVFDNFKAEMDRHSYLSGRSWLYHAKVVSYEGSGDFVLIRKPDSESQR